MLTYRSPVHGIAVSNRNMSSTLQANKILNRVITTTNNSLQRTIDSSKNKGSLTANRVRGGARLVGLNASPQWGDLSLAVYSEEGNIGTPNDQQIYEEPPEGETFETLNTEDKAIITLFVDVQYSSDLQSTKTVIQKSPKQERRKTTSACHVWMHVQTDEGNRKAIKTLWWGAQLAFKTPKRDDDRMAPSNDDETRKRDKGTSATPEGHNCINGLYGKRDKAITRTYRTSSPERITWQNSPWK